MTPHFWPGFPITSSRQGKISLRFFLLIFLSFLFLVIFLIINNVYAANQIPVAGTIIPSSGSSVPNTAVTFTATYTDADGWQDIFRGMFIVDTVVDGSNPSLTVGL